MQPAILRLSTLSADIIGYGGVCDQEVGPQKPTCMNRPYPVPTIFWFGFMTRFEQHTERQHTTPEGHARLQSTCASTIVDSPNIHKVAYPTERLYEHHRIFSP